MTEFYGELSLPLIEESERYWVLDVAGRSSHYSTSGVETTYKVSTLFQPVSQLSLRGSFSTGFRAPGIGELFGGAAREDFAFLDPCADVLGQFGSANGGRDAPQPGNIIANCAALGVPTDFIQTHPQLAAISAGNTSLRAEKSDSFTFGLVWSANFEAGWIARLTASVDYYEIDIDDAIQGRDPRDLLIACVNTLNPLFCDLAPRASSGALSVIDNQLQNIGGIEASGYDVLVSYASPEWPVGRFGVTVNATFLNDYTERVADSEGGETVTERTGVHTNETFQGAFPELRWVATIDWRKNRWAGATTFRWIDEMTLDGGSQLDSALFTDLRLSYKPDFLNDGWTVSVGFNNLFDKDPPVCFPCGVIGMSQVAHDLPGRVGYLRISYRREDGE